MVFKDDEEIADFLSLASIRAGLLFAEDASVALERQECPVADHLELTLRIGNSVTSIYGGMARRSAFTSVHCLQGIVEFWRERSYLLRF